jgi:cytochrome c-type biogenesis protein CcmE
MPEASEGAAPATAPAAPTATASPPAGRRRFSARRVRLIVVVAVVAVIVFLLLWGMVPERILEVRQVLGDASSNDGRVVQVKGVVRDWNATTGNFTLVDSSQEAKAILVHRSGSFPEGFGENVSVIVKGKFTVVGEGYTMTASEIQVGCPSKY